MVRCHCCRAAIKVKHKKGPLPLYCSRRCRQLAYERRRHTGPMVALAQDIATAKVRDVIREEVLSLLSQIGLMPPKSPPPPRTRATREKPKLRIV
jgi:hypothetical protein